MIPKALKSSHLRKRNLLEQNNGKHKIIRKPKNTFLLITNKRNGFSIVDIIAVLTDSNNPQVYWRVLKTTLAEEMKPLQIVTV
jgi:hypothetical protein